MKHFIIIFTMIFFFIEGLVAPQSYLSSQLELEEFFQQKLNSRKIAFSQRLRSFNRRLCARQYALRNPQPRGPPEGSSNGHDFIPFISENDPEAQLPEHGNAAYAHPANAAEAPADYAENGNVNLERVCENGFARIGSTDKIIFQTQNLNLGDTEPLLMQCHCVTRNPHHNLLFARQKFYLTEVKFSEDPADYLGPAVPQYSFFELDIVTETASAPERMYTISSYWEYKPEEF